MDTESALTMVWRKRHMGWFGLGILGIIVGYVVADRAFAEAGGRHAKTTCHTSQTAS